MLLCDGGLEKYVYEVHLKPKTLFYSLSPFPNRKCASSKWERNFFFRL